MWREMRGKPRTCGSEWRLSRLGLLDVAGDLRDELLLALEGALVAQATPELKHEPLAVEVAFEVQEVRLAPPLAAAVVRVGADRDCRPVTFRGARVDSVLWHEQRRVQAEGGGGK